MEMTAAQKTGYLVVGIILSPIWVGMVAIAVVMAILLVIAGLPFLIWEWTLTQIKLRRS